MLKFGQPFKHIRRKRDFFIGNMTLLDIYEINYVHVYAFICFEFLINE